MSATEKAVPTFEAMTERARVLHRTLIAASEALEDVLGDAKAVRSAFDGPWDYWPTDPSFEVAGLLAASIDNARTDVVQMGQWLDECEEAAEVLYGVLSERIQGRLHVGDDA